MKPSDEIIEKFRRIYFEEFAEELPKEEAYEKFLRLVNFLIVILRPTLQKGQDAKNHSSVLFNRHSENDKLKKIINSVLW